MVAEGWGVLLLKRERSNWTNGYASWRSNCASHSIVSPYSDGLNVMRLFATSHMRSIDDGYWWVGPATFTWSPQLPLATQIRRDGPISCTTPAGVTSRPSFSTVLNEKLSFIVLRANSSLLITLLFMTPIHIKCSTSERCIRQELTPCRNE
jgi:hypothetical protein